MSPVNERFARWVDWLGVSQAVVAEQLGCSGAMVSFLYRGERTVAGLKLALAIEREMARPRADGATFGEPPIDPSEWVAVEAAGAAE